MTLIDLAKKRNIMFLVYKCYLQLNLQLNVWDVTRFDVGLKSFLVFLFAYILRYLRKCIKWYIFSWQHKTYIPLPIYYFYHIHVHHLFALSKAKLFFLYKEQYCDKQHIKYFETLFLINLLCILFRICA